MRSRNPDTAGFTLLELVVVLAILAVVTTLALRSLDQVQDQQRDEANRSGMQALHEAILGSPDDRAADGSRMISGFVADMGRLPKAVEIDGNLTLAELWVNPGHAFDVRPAIAVNGVPPAYQDSQVFVSGGWRGPYLRLPIGAETWLDGWGNPMTSTLDSSPPDPDGAGYARLRDLSDNPLTGEQEVRMIRHLGANGILDSADEGYDRDGVLVFDDASYQVTLTAQVEVMKDDSPATVDPADTVTVCVFGPDPVDPTKIKVVPVLGSFSSNPITFGFPGLTIGPRVVRVYFADSGSLTTSFTRSAVKNVVLRPGANFVEVRIDR
jgi:prepilin-type N-terminal cleavage/methylation domain-containing protein